MRTIPIVNLPGSFPVAAARSGGRIVRAVGDAYTAAPGNWAPRAAQFAPRAVYIPGGGTTWCGRKERRMVTADLLSRARAGDGEAFRELAGSPPRQLQLHRHRLP